MRLITLVFNITIAVNCYGRGEFPIYGGRLVSDLNAGGFSITNMATDFASSIGALTNADAFATAAQGAKADDALTAATNAVSVANAALPRTSTNGWEVGSHATLYPRNNPSNFVNRAQATNGMQVAGAYLTAEADTLATVTARGATTTEAVTIGSRGIGAVGVSSLANGVGVVANGDASHAEGGYTTASGYASHAEGLGATASGENSHAEGFNTTASGENSHAEGFYTTASGDASHAEGVDTIASGENSHASGFNAVASNITAFAWQGSSGDFAEPEYVSHGNGTFNINPVGGTGGFWIGEQTLAALLNAKQTAETVVTGAVGTASAGNRYFWTTATNVTLSVNLSGGQVVNLAKLNNTGTNSITAIGAAGWEWTGGDMTNTITAGKSMTFGFLVDPSNGKTNAYATGVSK